MKKNASYILVGLILAACPATASSDNMQMKDKSTDSDSILVLKPVSNSGGEIKVFDVVEQMPSFPGGPQALMEYLGNNVKYPPVAAELGLQGRVVVSFVVERDGSLTDVKVERSVDPSLDKEAVRVVKSMPRWIPGKQKGKEVRVKFNVPVAFRLQ